MPSSEEDSSEIKQIFKTQETQNRERKGGQIRRGLRRFSEK